MPRRKGHGIPPTKRIKTEHQPEQNAISQSAYKLISLQDQKEDDESNSTKATTTGSTTVTTINRKRNSSVGPNITTSGNGGIDISSDQKRRPGDSFTELLNNSESDGGSTASSNPLADSHYSNKYLHKKFKKMASTVHSPEDAMVVSSSTSSSGSISVTTAVNGSRVKGVLCSVPVNSNSNSNNNNNNNQIVFDSILSVGDKKPILNSSSDCPRVESPTPPSTLGRYTCPYCKLACAKPSVLQKHIRAHTNERPYPCEPCGFAFKTKSNLYKHCRSRAHTLKMGELGIEEGGGNDRFCLPEENTESSGNDAETGEEIDVASIGRAILTSKEEKRDDGCQPKSMLYKPKFHTASIYLNDGKDSDNNSLLSSATHSSLKDDLPKGTSSKFHPGLSLKIPSASLVTSSISHNLPLMGSPTQTSAITSSASSSAHSTPSPFTSGSSPSPEFLQRHISKLISENQAIVETMDPFWPKKFLQRSNSKEASLSSPIISTSQASSEVAVPKKFRIPSSGSDVPLVLTNQELMSDPEKVKQQQNLQSKLALALLRPQMSVSPIVHQQQHSETVMISSTDIDQQPLNLSTNSSSDSQKRESRASHNISGLNSRKRSYSEGFPSSPTGIKYGTDIDVLSPMSNNHLRLNAEQFLLKSSKTDGSIDDINLNTFNLLESGKLLKTKDSPDKSSIIKDLLINARIVSGSSGVPSSYMSQLASSIDVSGQLSNSKYDGDHQDSYVCQFCNVPYRNAQNLGIHQLYYCKENFNLPVTTNSITNSTSYLPSISSALSTSPIPRRSTFENRQQMNLKTPVSESGKILKPVAVISPPFPSPGPLLGNTPLIDNCHSIQANVLPQRDIRNNKKMINKSTIGETTITPVIVNSCNKNLMIVPTAGRHDKPININNNSIKSKLVSSITLRSLEELSKCPMRSNSLQMFGGEVKILDNPGGEKTLRIEPSSNRTSSPSDMSSLMHDLKPNGDDDDFSDNEGRSKEKKSDKTSQIVVTIAKTGLHSGGTIVQLPTQKGIVANPHVNSDIDDDDDDDDDDNDDEDEEFDDNLDQNKLANLSNTGSTVPNKSSNRKIPPLLSVTNERSKYSQANKLMIPMIPNLTVPGITGGIPLVPIKNNHDHGFNVINPLTSITGYNPLTLPTAALINNTNNNNSNNNSSACSPYGGGIVTILHGGKPIPYVPGMPGPQTLIQTAPPPLTMIPTNSEPPATLVVKTTNKSSADNNNEKISPKNLTVKLEESNANKNNNVIKNTAVPINQQYQQSVDVSRTENNNNSNSFTNTTINKSSNLAAKSTVTSPLPVISIERLAPSSENESDETKCEKKFLRPTSLPLKPGTFTPKRHTLSTPNNVLPLVSPETPRPRKSYGQLYLNGHAYTYLGLKCSTRVFFCTLNKPQPIYVPLTPEHGNVSMYSNWKICSDADPNPFGLDPGKAMRYYDSRHRPGCYTVAQTPNRFNQLSVTHSSYWTNRNSASQQLSSTEVGAAVPTSSLATISAVIKTSSSPPPEISEPPQSTSPVPVSSVVQKIHGKAEKEESVASLQQDGGAPKRVKIFAGGFESNEDYIYIRGRGRGRYVCEECGIRCKKPSMLKKHIRTHTDVRPFTCRHCKFSFKTKGNLTKHMKSKAHYKRCVELGLNPVPILVDDSCINEEMLARQQALRADQGLPEIDESDEDDDDGEEDEEGEDEEEEDIEDEEDYDDDLADDNDDELTNDWKSKMEREAAARSLLSLSEVAIAATSSVVALPSQSQLLQAGLIGVRPAMYPYSFVNVADSSLSTSSSSSLSIFPQHSSQPQTPTLTAVTAQREREKVSHNTRLARDLSSEGQHQSQVAICTAQKLAAARFETGGDNAVASRYYFPSASNKFCGEKKTVSTPTTPSSTGLNKKKSGVEYGQLSFTGQQKPVGSSGAVDVKTCDDLNSPVVIADSENSIKVDSHSEMNTSSVAIPIDLSNKCIDNVKCSNANNKSSSSDSRWQQVHTCEAALLLASLCSTVDSLPNLKRPSSHMINDMITCDITSPHPNSAIEDNHNNHLLQAYITERAVKQQTIKQQSYVNTASFSVATSQQPLQLNQNSPKLVIPAVITTTTTAAAMPVPKLVVTTQHQKKSSSVINETDKLPAVEIPATSSVVVTQPVSTELLSSVGRDLHSSAKENALDILVKSSDVAKKHAALKLSTNASTVSDGSNFAMVGGSSTGSPNKKLKAEFLPPSSGPSPSYVSVLEDGRSMCLICNKIFTKPSQMRLHVNIHYFERPFRCESCAVSFRTKGHLQKHQRSVTHLNKMSMNSTFGTATTTNPRPFKCDDCKIAFRIHGHLAKHLRSKMHIMKLECLGKLPFGTYAEMERSGINMNDIDTSDCENSLESLQLLAQKLYEKDPSKLGQWDPVEMMPTSTQQVQQHNRIMVVSSTSSSSGVEQHHQGVIPSQSQINYYQQHQGVQNQNDTSSDEDYEDDGTAMGVLYHSTISAAEDVTQRNQTSVNPLRLHQISSGENDLSSSRLGQMKPCSASLDMSSSNPNNILQNVQSTIVKHKIRYDNDHENIGNVQTPSMVSASQKFKHSKEVPPPQSPSVTVYNSNNNCTPNLIVANENSGYLKGPKHKDEKSISSGTLLVTNIIDINKSVESNVNSNRSVIQRIKCSNNNNDLGWQQYNLTNVTENNNSNERKSNFSNSNNSGLVSSETATTTLHKSDDSSTFVCQNRNFVAKHDDKDSSAFTKRTQVNESGSGNDDYRLVTSVNSNDNDKLSIVDNNSNSANNLSSVTIEKSS